MQLILGLKASFFPFIPAATLLLQDRAVGYFLLEKDTFICGWEAARW